MGRDEGRRDGDPTTAVADTILVGFAAHHVVIRSESPAVAADLRSAFGAMVIDAPAGGRAGVVDAVPVAGGIRVGGTGLEAAPRVVAPDWASREAYHDAVKLLILARNDLVWVHAGVAARDGRAHLFCGPSGQGKSTLVGALVRLGWTYLSDEIGAIDASAGVVHPFPLAPRRRIHDGDFVPLDDAVAIRKLRKVSVDTPEHAVAQDPFPLERIYLLRYSHSTQGIATVPCAPAQAVIEVLRNSLGMRDDRRHEIASIARLVASVPVVEFRYPDAEAAASFLHAERATPTGSPHTTRDAPAL